MPRALRRAQEGGRRIEGLLTGRRLARVTDVEFPGRSGHVLSTPTTVNRHRVEVIVPRHATTGRPRPVDAGGHGTAASHVLRIVRARRLPAPGSFALLGSRVRPHKAFVDASRGVSLRYRFRAAGPGT